MRHYCYSGCSGDRCTGRGDIGSSAHAIVLIIVVLVVVRAVAHRRDALLQPRHLLLKQPQLHMQLGVPPPPSGASSGLTRAGSGLPLLHDTTRRSN